MASPHATHHPTPRRAAATARRVAMGVAACALGLTFTACSSSGSTEAASSGPATSGQAASQAAAARAAVDKWERPPTAIGVTVPLKSKPVPGKTIVFLQCELAQCQEYADGITAAAAVIGWHVRTINFQDSNPSTLTSGLQQALQYDPVAVSLSGVSIAEWSSVIPAYKKAGVPIIPISAGNLTTSADVPVSIQDLTSYQIAGQIIAEWFIATSGGVGHGLLVNVPSFEVLNAWGSAAAAVSNGCTQCKLTTLDASLNELSTNGIVPAVVSALQKDPTIKYILVSDGSFTSGLPAALNAAGLSGVTIAGNAPSIADEQDLLNGSEAAWSGTALRFTGWQVVDAAARNLEGMAIPVADGGLPHELLTKSTVGKPSDSLQEPANYPDLFKALWKVG